MTKTIVTLFIALCLSLGNLAHAQTSLPAGETNTGTTLGTSTATTLTQSLQPHFAGNPGVINFPIIIYDMAGPDFTVIGPEIDDGNDIQVCNDVTSTIFNFTGGNVWHDMATNVSIGAATFKLAGGTDGLLTALSGAGVLFAFDDSTGTMLKVPLPFAATGVSANDINHLYVLGPVSSTSGGNIYKLNVSTGTYDATTNGILATISVSSDGLMGGTKSDGSVWLLLNNVWTKAAAPVAAKQFKAVEKQIAYMLGTDGRMYQYFPFPNNFQAIGTVPPNPLTEFDAYNNGIFGVDTLFHVMKFKSGQWTQLAGRTARHITVPNAFDIFIADNNGHLARYLPNDSKRFITTINTPTVSLKNSLNFSNMRTTLRVLGHAFQGNTTSNTTNRCNPGVILASFSAPYEFQEDFWADIGINPTPLGTKRDAIRGTANVCNVALNCSNGVVPHHYQNFIDDFLDYAAGQRTCPMPPQYAWHCLSTWIEIPFLRSKLTMGVECAKTTETAPETCTDNYNNDN